MEQSLDQVQEYCSTQLKNYQSCIERHSDKSPEQWEVLCKTEKMELGKCCNENIPIVKHIRSKCHPEINSYQICLSENPSNPTDCLPALKSFYECSQKASMSFAADKVPK
ncbi:hypothetical protein BKA69DRAFT_1025962 [Paraphysoderma sedebokerense]|nr:hypothetical protein BKA69DRAFT_1025962 [Paraphysoderma sedebokerense]